MTTALSGVLCPCFSLVFIALGARLRGRRCVAREFGLRKPSLVLALSFGCILPALCVFPFSGKAFNGEPAAPGVGRAFVAGILFAFGWTPCVGPILAGILGMAAAAKRSTAVYFASFHSLGLGIPFILSAAFLNGSVSVQN
jgi:cytochrome c-type biogenesis protein